MNESDKDWDNPAFRKLYEILALADAESSNDALLKWLNRNGFCNLTVCPECHVDDFVHVEGCGIAKQLARTKVT